jgi:SM-20-related protein
MTLRLARYDDVLSPERRSEINSFLHEPGWKFGWKSNSKNDTFSFWHKHFAGARESGDAHQYECAAELEQNAPVIYGAWVYIAHRHFSNGERLVRCYANAHTYGSDGTLHTDSHAPDSCTAIYYPHDRWSPNWGGETVFFDAGNRDIVACAYPRPNRLVIFSGTIPHAARGVTRTCPVLRVTLMFKTFAPEANHGTADRSRPEENPDQ